MNINIKEQYENWNELNNELQDLIKNNKDITLAQLCEYFDGYNLDDDKEYGLFDIERKDTIYTIHAIGGEIMLDYHFQLYNDCETENVEWVDCFMNTESYKDYQGV